MTALPQANHTALEANSLDSYEVCLNFERNATSDVELMHARVLGYLILHAPSPTARRAVVHEVHSFKHEHDTLSELGQWYITHFIRPFKKFKECTPISSSHPSRPLFDNDKNDILATIKEAPKNHRDAKKQALIRDGFQCVLTGAYDMAVESFDICKEETDRVGVVNTECAHIIPYYAVSTTDSTKKTEHSAPIWAVLGRFGHAVDNLYGDKVHSLYNVMTMEKNMHDWFNRLRMWFEATAIRDCYLIRTIVNCYIKPPERVTFISTRPDNLPVPSPELLALHEACAKVAHLSGAGNHIDEFDRDMEDLHVLAADGTSTDVLCYALDHLMTRPCQ